MSIKKVPKKERNNWLYKGNGLWNLSLIWFKLEAHGLAIIYLKYNTLNNFMCDLEHDLHSNFPHK